VVVAVGILALVFPGLAYGLLLAVRTSSSVESTNQARRAQDQVLDLARYGIEFDVTQSDFTLPETPPSPPTVDYLGCRSGLLSRAQTALDQALQGTGASAVVESIQSWDRTRQAIPAAVITASGFVWVADSKTGAIWKIDPNAVQPPVEIVKPDIVDPAGLVFAGSRIWVTSRGTDQVGRINPNSPYELEKLVDVGDKPVGIASDGTYLWVANSGSDDVSRISISSPDNESLRALVPVGDHPVGVAYAGSGRGIWVTSRGPITGPGNDLADTVWRIDNASPAPVTWSMPTGDGPMGVTFGLNHVWVANSKSDSLVKISPSISPGPAGSPGVEVGAFTAGVDAPQSVTSDGTSVWVSQFSRGELVKVSASGAVQAVARVGSGPVGAALLSSGATSSMWVANSRSGDVSRVALADGTVSSPFQTLLGPCQVASDEVGAQLWTVSISGETHEILRKSEK
jgi:YVTN family beta-propeller protein